jgi:hypothetical protein
MRLSVIVAALLLVGANAFQTPTSLPVKRIHPTGASCRPSRPRQLQLMSAKDPSESSEQAALLSRRLLAKTIGLLPLGFALGMTVPTALSRLPNGDMDLVSFSRSVQK